MQTHPQYSVLIGPISISNDYSSTSQQLRRDFLLAYNYNGRLGRLSHLLSPYRGDFKPVWRKTDLAGMGVSTVSPSWW